MNSRQRVVVTGGIGSGKSTVIDALSQLGWSVIRADTVGHGVLTDPVVVAAITARWPTAVSGSGVSRSALARLVFAHPQELAALEEITHPLIVDRIDRWIEHTPAPTAVELAVLKVAKPHWGWYVVVHAPVVIRSQRALARGMSAVDVAARTASQPDDSEWLASAHLVLDNRGSTAQLRGNIEKLHDRLTT